jgi:carbamoyl-phosphate synthase large subunit
MRDQMRAMAEALEVVGLMNAQFAIKDNDIYVLEVNPRASRTVPFVSKAIGMPLAKIAARCMVGRSLSEQGVSGGRVPAYFSVKEAVFPFIRFPGVDPLLGPEMKSTGEVMGVGRSFGEAFAKAQIGAGEDLPRSGRVFISVRKADREDAMEVATELANQGFRLVATRGTAAAISKAGVACEIVNKVTEGRPHIVDMIKNEQIDLIVNTTEGKQAIADSYTIRGAALQHKVPYSTTIAHAYATSLALTCLDSLAVERLQDLHEEQIA